MEVLDLVDTRAMDVPALSKVVNEKPIQRPKSSQQWLSSIHVSYHFGNCLAIGH